MSFTYGVLGGGRQGTAAAYDMAKFGEAKKVVIADIDKDAALASADRVNTLTHSEIAEGVALDVTDRSALASFLDPVDSFLSAVPYWLNPAITEAAIQARASMCDLGGNTDLVREQLKLDAAAVEAGVAVVPDCGQVPGMGTSLMVRAMSLLDRADHVFMWDGGNVQHPEPPFNYRCTFNIAGLTNEYYGEAIFLRNGKVTMVPTFQREDYEEIEFPAPIGSDGGVRGRRRDLDRSLDLRRQCPDLPEQDPALEGSFRTVEGRHRHGSDGPRPGHDQRGRGGAAGRPPRLCRAQDPGRRRREGLRHRPRQGGRREGRSAGRGAGRADRFLRRDEPGSPPCSAPPVGTAPSSPS